MDMACWGGFKDIALKTAFIMDMFSINLIAFSYPIIHFLSSTGSKVEHQAS